MGLPSIHFEFLICLFEVTKIKICDIFLSVVIILETEASH